MRLKQSNQITQIMSEKAFYTIFTPTFSKYGIYQRFYTT